MFINNYYSSLQKFQLPVKYAFCDNNHIIIKCILCMPHNNNNIIYKLLTSSVNDGSNPTYSLV